MPHSVKLVDIHIIRANKICIQQRFINRFDFEGKGTIADTYGSGGDDAYFVSFLE